MSGLCNYGFIPLSFSSSFRSFFMFAFHLLYYGGVSFTGSLGFSVLFVTTGDACFMLTMPCLEFGHCSSIIKQSQFHTPQQVLQVQYSLERENTANCIGGLSSLVQPFQCFLTIELDGSGYSKRVVSSDLLDELTVSWRTCIGYHNEVEGPLFAAVAL